MPLTRHLYELDEVVSALQTCLRNGWPRAPFWTWEIVVSGEAPLALKVLRTLWLEHGGGFDPTVLDIVPGGTSSSWVDLTMRIGAACRAAKGLTADTFIRRTAVLSTRPDVTPLPRSPLAARRRAERSAAFVASLDEDEVLDRAEAAEWWVSIDAACRQGSRTSAAWLLQAAAPLLSTSAIWSAIEIAARAGLRPVISKLRTSVADDLRPATQMLAQVNALLLLCAQGAEARESMLRIPHELPCAYWKAEWDRWNTMVGRRSARIYPIPAEALHAGTTRGSMSRRFTNIADVREPMASLLEGCAYWRAEAAAAGIVEDEETGAILFPSDEALERFCNQHFPDDIPDEWSRTDQEKSHGRGCAETAPPEADPLPIREEPVSQRAWRMAIGVRRAPKKLTHASWRGGRC